MGYACNFCQAQWFCALNNDSLVWQLVFFQYKFDEQVKRQCLLHMKTKGTLTPICTHLHYNQSWMKFHFLALISETKHLEKFSTGCVTTLVKCWHNQNRVHCVNRNWPKQETAQRTRRADGHTILSELQGQELQCLTCMWCKQLTLQKF